MVGQVCELLKERRKPVADPAIVVKTLQTRHGGACRCPNKDMASVHPDFVPEGVCQEKIFSLIRKDGDNERGLKPDIASPVYVVSQSMSAGRKTIIQRYLQLKYPALYDYRQVHRQAQRAVSLPHSCCWVHRPLSCGTSSVAYPQPEFDLVFECNNCRKQTTTEQ